MRARIFLHGAILAMLDHILPPAFTIGKARRACRPAERIAPDFFLFLRRTIFGF